VVGSRHHDGETTLTLHWPGRVVVAVIVPILSACDSTGPGERPIAIAISAEATAPDIGMPTDSTVIVECSANLTASVSGSERDIGTWEGGEARWFAGLDRTTPFHVEPIAGFDITETWGSDRLTHGDTLRSVWRFTASLPFIVELDFRYTSHLGDRVSTASTAIECGLDLDMPVAPPPAISDLVIQTPTPFQPGDVFTVSYHATAAAGLLASIIEIDGAYTGSLQVVEELSRDSRRTVEFIVPHGVRLGDPLYITVQPFDVFTQTTTRVEATTQPLVDVTPPVLAGAYTHRTIIGEPVRLIGQYGAGDSLFVQTLSSDNQGLGFAILDIDAQRYAFQLAGAEAVRRLDIRVTPDLVGSRTLAVHVTDVSGLTSARFESPPDSLLVYPVIDRPTVALEFPNEGFIAAAWDEVNGLLYLALRDRPEIVVIGTGTMTEQRRIALPGRPGGVDFTMSGDSLFASLPERSSIAVIRLADDIVTEIPLAAAGVGNPRELAVLENGHVLIEANDGAGQAHIARVDPANPAAIAATQIPALNPGIARSRDRSTVGILTELECLIVYRAATDGFDPCIQFRARTMRFAADETGSRFIIGGSIVDVPAGTTRGAVWGMRVNVAPASVFTADGQSIFLSDDTGLLNVRVSDGNVIDRTPLPLMWDGILLVSEDGSTVFAVGDMDELADEVRVIRVQLQ
jgi:hypothetical protein